MILPPATLEIASCGPLRRRFHTLRAARHRSRARIGLDYERKTVKNGALFYQEFIPAEALFYAAVFTTPSRREGDSKPAAAVLQYLRDHLQKVQVLQIGGDETTGKGFCTARLVDGKGN